MLSDRGGSGPPWGLLVAAALIILAIRRSPSARDRVWNVYSAALGLLDAGYSLLAHGGSPKNAHAGYGDLGLFLEVSEMSWLLGRARSVLAAPLPVGEARWTREGALHHAEVAFTSPAADVLEPECRSARAQVVAPRPDAASLRGRPVVVLLGATGEEGFAGRRRQLSRALLSGHGVASVILENPFYGPRRLPGQRGTALPKVQHFATQTAGVVLEALAVARWASEVAGASAVGVAGFSYGGAMAALCGLVCPASLDLFVAAVAPSHGPGPPFCEGVLRGSVAWPALRSAPGEPPEVTRARLSGLLSRLRVEMDGGGRGGGGRVTYVQVRGARVPRPVPPPSTPPPLARRGSPPGAGLTRGPPGAARR